MNCKKKVFKWWLLKTYVPVKFTAMHFIPYKKIHCFKQSILVRKDKVVTWQNFQVSVPFGRHGNWHIKSIWKKWIDFYQKICNTFFVSNYVLKTPQIFFSISATSGHSLYSNDTLLKLGSIKALCEALINICFMATIGSHYPLSAFVFTK